MAYTPQEWKDNSTQHPASAARFTHMEQGISGAHTLAQAAAESVTGVQAKQAELDKKIEGIATPAKPTAEDIAPAVRSYLEANPVAVQEDALTAAVTKAVQERVSHLPPAELPADFNTTVENLVKAELAKAAPTPSGDGTPAAPAAPVDEAKIREIVDTAIKSKLAEGDGGEPAADASPEDPFRWFKPGQRYWCPVTYWWADQRQPGSKWDYIFGNLDIIGFVIINPRSGFGDKVEPDFTDLTTQLKNKNVPGVGYVRTIKGTKSTDDVLAEIRKYQEAYHLEGVFLDEMINGWAPSEAALIDQYKDLYKKIKAEFGKGFLVVGNPGTNTKPEILECADIIMSFEKAASAYLDDAAAPVTPDHYRAESPLRFIHTIHNLESVDQMRKVLAKADVSNVGFFYATDDTFSGVEGSENQDNNPWDSVPSEKYRAMQFRWCRRQEEPVEQVIATGDPGAIWVHDSALGEVVGGDITANLQKAVNAPNIHTIKIPSGKHKIKTVTMDKIAGKKIVGAGRNLTQLDYDKSATQVPFLVTSGSNSHRSTLQGFAVNMDWKSGDPERNAFQVSNAMLMDYIDLLIVNAGANGILHQSAAVKDNPKGLDGSSIRFRDVDIDGAGLADKTTGFGIQLKGNVNDVSMFGLRVKGVKGGMGVGGVFDAAAGAGPSRVSIEGSSIGTAESTTAFEPIGFTKGCDNIIVRGNHLWSFDNGTSLSGSGCLFEGNTVYQGWNFGVSVGSDDADFQAAVGTRVIGNLFYDLALENEKRPDRGTFEYAVVRFAKAKRCVVANNVYAGRAKILHHFIKVQGQNHGFNQVYGNAVDREDFLKEPFKGQVETDQVQEWKTSVPLTG